MLSVNLILQALRTAAPRGIRRLASVTPEPTVTDPTLPITTRDARRLATPTESAKEGSDVSRVTFPTFQITREELKQLLTEVLKFSLEQSSTESRWVYRGLMGLAGGGALAAYALAWEIQRMETRLKDDSRDMETRLKDDNRQMETRLKDDSKQMETRLQREMELRFSAQREAIADVKQAQVELKQALEKNFADLKQQLPAFKK